MAVQPKTLRILIAGFGGQGVLFLGKLIALCGMSPEREVTWLPSYGPEMRGGTANCAVILSREAIGSPIVDQPDVLIAMNLPSFEAYQHKVAVGGRIIYDSALVGEAPARTDIAYDALPATRMATEHGLDGLSNMILFGRFLRECLPLDDAAILPALEQVIPAHKKHLLEANLTALALGREDTNTNSADLINERNTEEKSRRAG
jgi:2-oxoglutarate ferredoxin oxidoreductase subunit gamma